METMLQVLLPLESRPRFTKELATYDHGQLMNAFQS